MATIPGVPLAGLRRALPIHDYRRLVNEPVKAWILVRGQVIDQKVFGARVVRSEANGVYDKVAVQIANGMGLYSFGTGTRIAPSVVVHVLIFQLPHGQEDAIALAQDDTVGATNLASSHSMRMVHLGLAGAKPAAGKPPHSKGKH